MPPVSATPPYSFTPRGAAAVAYRVAPAYGGVPGPARRRPLMASSVAEVTPLRILVVEPDARARSLLEVGLSRAGFSVIAAHTLTEAQDLMGVGRALPSMLVCEADLRGEDGFRFCGQLRADLRTAQVPVVMLSQRPESFHLEMAGGSGVDDYLPKPVFLNDVVALARLKAGESASQAVFDADSARLPMGELLRALLAGMRSGHIELKDGTARLSFRQGQVVDCELEGVRGARALSRMLLLARGPYQVTFGPALARGTLCVDLRELCRSVLPDLARSRRAQERSLPLEAVLQPDTARLREVLPDLPDGVNSLVRLFDGERTLKQVILRCELPEASALLITTRLYGLGALGPEESRVLAAPAAPLAVVTITSPDNLEQALASVAERASAPVLALAPAPAPAAELPAPLPPAPAPAAMPAEPARPYLRAQLQDDFAERLDEALQRAAAATAQAALTPPKTSIVDVHYFASRRTSGTITQPLPIAAVRPRRWWRSVQAKVAAGALALFIGSAAVGSVLFRPAATEAQAPAASPSTSSPDFSVLPDWLAPRAVGTAESWVTLGRRYYDEGDLEGAKAAAIQALALDPESGPALLLLATIQYGMNQPVEAKAALRRYLAVDPDGQFAPEARTLLER